jgi:hypothetical protein
MNNNHKPVEIFIRSVQHKDTNQRGNASDFVGKCKLCLRQCCRLFQKKSNQSDRSGGFQRSMATSIESFFQMRRAVLHYVNEHVDTGFIATVVPAIIFLVIFATATKKATNTRRKSPPKDNNNHNNNANASGNPAIHKQRQRTMRMDQIVFTGSIVNLGVMMYWMGQWPQYFWIWHLVNAIVLISIRWYVFRQDKQHYFLYDFCYWANLYSIVYVTISAENHNMFQVLFMVSNGPLAWSIPAFKSRAVFHNLQQMTTIFIHFSPMALTFCLRWTNAKHEFAICEGGDKNPDSCGDISASHLVILAITRFYLWWMVLYFMWVFIILDKRVKRKGYTTLFTWMANTHVMGDIIRAISPSEVIQKAVYLLGHYVFALITMVLATFLWKNFYLHLVFLAGIGTFAAWNGAGYYLNIFTSRYEQEVDEKVKKRLAEMRSPSTPPLRRRLSVESNNSAALRSSSSLR